VSSMIRQRAEDEQSLVETNAMLISQRVRP
jgi:hypothetical protein